MVIKLRSRKITAHCNEMVKTNLEVGLRVGAPRGGSLTKTHYFGPLRGAHAQHSYTDILIPDYDSHPNFIVFIRYKYWILAGVWIHFHVDAITSWPKPLSRVCTLLILSQIIPLNICDNNKTLSEADCTLISIKMKSIGIWWNESQLSNVCGPRGTCVCEKECGRW